MSALLATPNDFEPHVVSTSGEAAPSDMAAAAAMFVPASLIAQAAGVSPVQASGGMPDLAVHSTSPTAAGAGAGGDSSSTRETPATAVANGGNGEAETAAESAVAPPAEPAPPRLFWKSGDEQPRPPRGVGEPAPRAAKGLDHARLHPRFLHSNATAHKW